jgi:hypothetical protein
MTANGPKEPDVLEYLEGISETWERDRNPLHIWLGVKVCIDFKTPFPEWVLDYLGECGDRVVEAMAGSGATKDIRKALPSIFQFSRGRGPGGYGARARKDVENERFAVAYAAAIFSGKDPVPARAEASEKQLKKFSEDGTLRRRLQKYFRVPNSPDDNASWRAILVEWLMGRPYLLERYRKIRPSLPEDWIQLVRMHAEPHGGGGSYDISADGRISRVEASHKRRSRF